MQNCSVKLRNDIRASHWLKIYKTFCDLERRPGLAVTKVGKEQCCSGFLVTNTVIKPLVKLATVIPLGIV